MAAEAPVTRIAVIALAALACFALACDPAPPPAGVAPPDLTATRPPDARTPVAVDLVDTDEAARVGAALEAAGFALDASAGARVSDRALAGGAVHPVAAWALVAHPRVERLDLTLDEAHAVLRGEIDAWEALEADARPLPLALYLSAEAAPWAAREFPGHPGTVLPLAEVIARVAAEPGAVGLVPYEAPELGVVALTVDGHDPYRDPAATAPLADRRWVLASDDVTATRIASAAGWTAVSTYDPAGILATGELIPARCVHSTLTSDGRTHDSMFDATRDLIAAADYAIAPWEPSVVDAEPTPCTLTFNLQAAPEAAEAVARAGFDVAFTVGNHLGDCWTECAATEAMRETVRLLRNAGLATTGAGDDLAEAAAAHTDEIDGVRFAFLAYDEVAREFYGAGDDHAGTNPLDDLDRLVGDVRLALESADHLIVGFSWGVEYVSDPSSAQIEAARAVMDAGASLVVGNHPHWVQATERMGRGVVLYALGNFVFDQDWSVETQQGLIVEAGFTADRMLGIRYRPVMIRERHRPEPVSPASAEGRAILDQLWAATDRRGTRD
ncbi:MAG: hypothetical protein AMXMBFR23_04080 [Chloroflexota bacterium]